MLFNQFPAHQPSGLVRRLASPSGEVMASSAKPTVSSAKRQYVAGGGSRNRLQRMNTEILCRHAGMVSRKPKLSWGSGLQEIPKTTTRASVTTSAVKGWTRKM